VKTTNALGHTEYSAYDPAQGVVLQQTGPNGINTCFTYNDFGRQKSATVRCGTVDALTTTMNQYTAIAGDPQGSKVVTVKRPPTGETTWVYSDVFGRAVYTRGRSFDGGFTETTATYDHLGRLFTDTKPRLIGTAPTYGTFREYDDLGRTTKVTEALGQIGGTTDLSYSIKWTTYDGFTVTTDEHVNGQDHQNPRSETKNVLGKVSSVMDAAGTSIYYWYDADGNLTRAGDPVQHALPTVQIAYDIRGRKTASDDPDLGLWRYEYDAFGDLMKQTDAKDQETRMTYDQLGRLVSKTDASGTAQWLYDVAPGKGVGKLAAMLGAPDPSLKGSCDIPYDLVNDGNRTGRWFTYTQYGEVETETQCADGADFATQHSYTLGRLGQVR
jgi:YD repeat-containing protein